MRTSAAAQLKRYVFIRDSWRAIKSQIEQDTGGLIEKFIAIHENNVAPLARQASSTAPEYKTGATPHRRRIALRCFLINRRRCKPHLNQLTGIKFNRRSASGSLVRAVCRLQCVVCSSNDDSCHQNRNVPAVQRA